MSDEMPIGPNACPRCGGEYGEHRDWCKRSHSFAPAPGSPAHVHFEIKTEAGNSAMILGDPNMPEATRKALAAMIDAVVKMSNASAKKVPANAELTHGANKP